MEWFEDPYDCASNINCLVILTEWNQFRALDLKKIAQDIKAILVDLRNIYEVEDVKDAGSNITIVLDVLVSFRYWSEKCNGKNIYFWSCIIGFSLAVIFY